MSEVLSRDLRTVIDVVSQPLWIIAPDGAIEYANDAAALALGIGHRSDLRGRSSHDALHAVRRNGSPYPAHECPIVWATRSRREATGTELFGTTTAQPFAAKWKVSALPGQQSQLLAFHPLHSTRPVAPGDTKGLPSAQSLRAQIAQRFRDPNLTPLRLARDNNISLRTLQSILTGDQGSPAALIRRHRLNHARGLLNSGESVRAAAIAAGFFESDTFSRAFRREFGVTAAGFARNGENSSAELASSDAAISCRD